MNVAKNTFLLLSISIYVMPANKSDKKHLLSKKQNPYVLRLYKSIKKLSLLYRTSQSIPYRKLNATNIQQLQTHHLSRIVKRYKDHSELFALTGEYAFEKKQYFASIMCYKIEQTITKQNQVTFKKLQFLNKQFQNITKIKQTARTLYIT